MYTGSVLKLGGYRIVVMARLNTLPPNAAKTAETVLEWSNGKRTVRIRRARPAPCIWDAVKSCSGTLDIPPTSTRLISGTAEATLARTRISGLPYRFNPTEASHFWFHTKIYPMPSTTPGDGHGRQRQQVDQPLQFKP